MSFKFGIVGAGWYGCHIASSFKALGFEVTVYDMEDDVLCMASGNNQFRLHQGFHYARNYRTRVQSRDGYMRFLERYPNLSKKIEHNLYAVPDKDSLLDFLTYKLIMTSSGVEFTEVESQLYELKHCTGLLSTNERLICTDKSRSFFKNRLKEELRLGVKIESIHENDKEIIINGSSYDYMIDATWGSLGGIDQPVFYEPTLLLYYRSRIGSFALTMVDGNLCSIYPTDKPDIFTLSSVTHTPLGKFDTMSKARGYLNDISSDVINEKRKLMEAQISHYYPRFYNEFEYVGPQFSVKTKIIGSTDDRSCYVRKKGRRFTVLSGKIDTIFYASESIISSIELDNQIEVGRI